LVSVDLPSNMLPTAIAAVNTAINTNPAAVSVLLMIGS
jgi:hypothetical protein